MIITVIEWKVEILWSCTQALPRPVGKTPYQGQKRCFGEFECKTCGRRWMSGNSWANCGEWMTPCQLIAETVWADFIPTSQNILIYGCWFGYHIVQILFWVSNQVTAYIMHKRYQRFQCYSPTLPRDSFNQHVCSLRPGNKALLLWGGIGVVIVGMLYYVGFSLFVCSAQKCKICHTEVYPSRQRPVQCPGKDCPVPACRCLMPHTNSFLFDVLLYNKLYAARTIYWRGKG